MNDTPKEASDAKETTARGGGRVWLVLFVIAALGVVGAKLYWPVFWPEAKTTLSPVIDTVRGQSKPTGNAREPISKLTSPQVAPAPAVSTPAPTPAVSTPAPVVVAPAPVVQPVVVSSAPAMGNLDAEVSALNARIAQLETQLQTLLQAQAQPQPSQVINARASALALAVTGLSRPLTMGSPYRRTLDAVATFGEGDEVISTAVTTLGRYATHGVPTLATLQRSFPATARAVMRLRAQGESTGLMAKVKNMLGGLVTVRRTGTEPGKGGDVVEVALARAEAALTQNNLEAAVQALSQLSGPPANGARPWLEDATARLEAERALDALHARALSKLAASGG